MKYLWKWIRNENGTYDVEFDIKQDKNSDCVYANYIPLIEKEEDES